MRILVLLAILAPLTACNIDGDVDRVAESDISPSVWQDGTVWYMELEGE